LKIFDGVFPVFLHDLCGEVFSAAAIPETGRKPLWGIEISTAPPGSFALCSPPRYTADMNTANQPNVKFVQTDDYRDNYSNSVQIRVNVWDFFLVFGTMQQSSETQVELRNFQGIYLSPQQAKALMALLQQNVSNYEAAFGEIKLDPRAPGGPVH
jgi:flagellar protein FlaG